MHTYGQYFITFLKNIIDSWFSTPDYFYSWALFFNFMEILKQKEEILGANYWENAKFEKELSYYLPFDHPKRIKLREEVNELLEKWNNIKKEIKSKSNI